MSNDAVASNYTYLGHTALMAKGAFGFQDVRGPSLHKTLYVEGFEQVRCGVSRSSGKRYIEFNLLWESIHNCRYRVGLVAPTHPEGTKLADHADGWAFETASRKFVNGGTLTDPPTSGYDMFIICSPVDVGWFSYVISVTQSNRDGYILRMAVDFDVGKIWFGVCRGGKQPFKPPVDFWTGSPAAGTGNTFSFIPNTPLVPAICLINDATDFTWQNFIGMVSTVPAYCRGPLPSGFTYWDTEIPGLNEVLATSPYAYWLTAPPHLTTKTDIAYQAQNLDWGPNKQSLLYDFTDDDAYRSYRMMGGRLRTVFVNPRNSRPRYFYPISVSSAQNFVVEIAVELTDAGRWVTPSSKYWTEGSVLFQNAVDPRSGNIITLPNVWFGAAYNDDHIAFGSSGYNISYQINPQSGQVHYLAFECDYTNLYLRIYVNGALAAEDPFTTPGFSTSWLAVGACDPQVANGGFPGYFCEMKFYLTTFTAQQHAEHYALFMDGFMPNPIGSLIDGRTTRFPYFAI